MCVVAPQTLRARVCAHESLTYTNLRTRSLMDGRGEMALPSETSARTDSLINIA